MKKVKIFLMIALILSATGFIGFMASCSSDEPTVEPVKIITLNKTVVSLLTGATETLTVSFSPNNDGADKAVTWTSSNAAVATVSNGTITAVAKGETTVTVALTSNAAVKAEATVTVTPAVTSIALDKAELHLINGEEEKLTATILPADADQTVTWSTSDEAIAVVTADGTVQTKGLGEAVITATSVSDPTKKETATVTVYYGSVSIPAPKVELSLTAPTNTDVIQFINNGGSLGITQIAGPVAGTQALKFTTFDYAKITHGIAANGVPANGAATPATSVNVFTILIDFRVPRLEKYNAFFSICEKSPVDLDPNAGDATCYLRAAGDPEVLQDFGLGWGIIGIGSGGGYSNLLGDYLKTNVDCQTLGLNAPDHRGESGSVKVDTWYRVVMTHTLNGDRCSPSGTADGAYGIKRYLDGELIHAGGYTFNTRLAMYPSGVLIHADNRDKDAEGNFTDSIESDEMDIANIAIWDVQLTDGQVKALGKAGDLMSWESLNK